ncbi:MAG TPA: glutamate--tRNA ligase family protein, partial [Streptosporangiaceae bacterium]
MKTSATEPRLPTYHLAHAVDDHLMRVNEVIRAEEWISSVPLHHQLFDALGFDRLPYSHVAPLMKMAGNSKRKLSKRKDTEASVDFYIEVGFPADAALFYLRGLANGRLAELPITQALAEPIRLEECGVSGPLVDMVKLADISRALDVERVGVDNPRQDLAKWSEFRSTYGFFFRELFPVVRDPGDDRFGSLSPALVTEVAASFADGYFESDE